MKGYKATYNLKCKDLTYQGGKTYFFDGELIKCEQGLHFCKNIDDIFNYYTINNDIVIIEIETMDGSIIINDDDKTVTNKLMVNRIIPINEYNDLFKRHTFDSKGNMLCKTNPNGDVYEFTYDDKGNKLTQTNPNGDIYEITYDSKGNMLTQTYPDGNIYEITYDSKGNKLTQTYPDGIIYKWTYDSKGNMLCKTNPNGDVYEFTYDDKGNKLTQTYPDGDVYKYPQKDYKITIS